MSEISLLILIEMLGLTLSPRRFQDAEQRSMLALVMVVLGLTSFWQHVGPKSLLLSGAAEVYLRRNCSMLLPLLKSTSLRTPAYFNGCHVCLGGSEFRQNPSTENDLTNSFYKAKPTM